MSWANGVQPLMKVCGADAKTRTIRGDCSFDRRVGCVALRLDIDGRQTTKQEAFGPDCDLALVETRLGLLTIPSGR